MAEDSMPRSIAAAACAVGLAVAQSAQADECPLVNGNAIPPSSFASELENGYGSLPGQLAGVPFSVVSYESADIFWTGCAGECLINEYPGETACNDLVATPLDSFIRSEIAAVGDPPAFSEVSAEQWANGKWDVFATSFVIPAWENIGGSASYIFELGTRDVIDVSSAEEGLKPLRIRMQARSHLGVNDCNPDLGLFSWIPNHYTRFRVTEETPGPPLTRTLVPTTYHENFFGADDVFDVEVSANSTLTVDVYFRASANATGAMDVFGDQCSGGIAILDFAEDDGILVSYSPDPSLTFAPRSGIAYQTVPEPGTIGGVGGAGGALATLASRARRRAELA
jgi:hypothetical protein